MLQEYSEDMHMNIHYSFEGYPYMFKKGACNIYAEYSQDIQYAFPKVKIDYLKKYNDFINYLHFVCLLLFRIIFYHKRML